MNQPLTEVGRGRVRVTSSQLQRRHSQRVPLQRNPRSSVRRALLPILPILGVTVLGGIALPFLGTWLENVELSGLWAGLSVGLLPCLGVALLLLHNRWAAARP